MLRSLYSGVSGLEGTQVAMDVIGNNIANVNTTGFKAGRATFEDAMSQVVQSATSPQVNRGGINPMQVGLGASVGSIDTLTNEGNMQTTGKITDLAVQGNAYFVFSNGSSNVYSRDGSLQFDGNGKLVSSSGGYTLQGIMAASDGSYPAGNTLSDVTIPLNSKTPAKATEEVTYKCNLDSDSQALGTVTHSAKFLAAATGTQTLSSVHDQNGNSLGIQSGDIITVQTNGTKAETFVVGTGTGQINTLADLATSVQSYLTNAGITGATASINAKGQLEIVNGAGNPINGLQISSSNPSSGSYFAGAFSFSASIGAGATADTGVLLRPALSSDLLANVVDASGQSMGIENGDVITVNGLKGGSSIAGVNLTYADAASTTPTTVGDLLNTIQTAFNLPNTDGTPQNNPSVSINAADTNNDNVNDGSIVVRGQPGNAFAISGLSITATNSNSNGTAPTRFMANTSFAAVQDARDAVAHNTSIDVYDQSGGTHTLAMTFTPSTEPNVWHWQVATENGETIVGGDHGTMSFGQDGSPAAFTYADGSTSFKFDPMNGSPAVSINLNVGTPGSLAGVTQFNSATTTAAVKQDGYPMGKLEKIAIDTHGEITGSYSNGVSKSLAKILVADFNNPAGLLNIGNNMLTTSTNSGNAVLQQAGVGSTSTILGGQLEMSNVDLSKEFTNMISTERAYQANARLISTSDQLLQTLIQLGQ